MPVHRDPRYTPNDDAPQPREVAERAASFTMRKDRL